jgi:hypothetical protein
MGVLIARGQHLRQSWRPQPRRTTATSEVNERLPTEGGRSIMPGKG